MDSRYADAPQAILDTLKNWDAFSNSNPREGILAAIDKFYDPNKKISLYVYSDDFQQGSINPVVREIDRRNHANESGERLVRIHAVAFPAVYLMTGGDLFTAANYRDVSCASSASATAARS